MRANKRVAWGMAAAFGIGVMSACSVIGLSAPPTPTEPGSTPVATTSFAKQPDGSYLYQTNDSANKGHTLFYTSTASVSGAYTYEATVEKTSGGTAGGFGIVFRWLDNGNFWFVDIDTQGYYTVGEVKNGNITYATNQNNITWLRCSSLRSGYGLSNTIKIIFNGSSTYDLYFNGAYTMSFTEGNNTAGRLGLDAAVLSTENFPSVPVSVSFTVQQPSTLTFTALLGRSLRMIGDRR